MNDGTTQNLGLFTNRDATETTVANIPIIEEQLLVSKRIVETGTVRVQTRSMEHEESVQVPLETVSWRVERTALNVPVDQIPAPRHEGEDIIYPVVEERVVITRQLVLVEEVRVSRNVTHEQQQIAVSLRRDELIVERQPSPVKTT